MFFTEERHCPFNPLPPADPIPAAAGTGSGHLPHLPLTLFRDIGVLPDLVNFNGIEVE
jgi:hypothetical protein